MGLVKYGSRRLPAATSSPVEARRLQSLPLLWRVANATTTTPPIPSLPSADDLQKAAKRLLEATPPSTESALEPIEDGGGPRFVSPALQYRAAAQNPAKLPLMVYLPGIDGTGLAAYRQYPSLVKAFDLRALVLPPDDRTAFEELVEVVQAYLKEEVLGHAADRPVYLLGESFGGILTLAVAEKCRNEVDRVVLVNPATSFDRSVWPRLGPLVAAAPPEVNALLPYVLWPVLANPVAMASHNAIQQTSPLLAGVEVLKGLAEILPQLSGLSDVLPPATLQWRLELLDQGCQYMRGRYSKVPQRVLALAAEADLLIPSADEVGRLRRRLPRAHSRTFPMRSHALLLEAGVDLVSVLEEEGFYVQQRRMSSSGTGSGGLRNNGFAAAAPLELPTPKEIDRGAARSEWIRRLSSPVFLSMDQGGSVVRGLGNVPMAAGRPVILVGNHQSVAPDLPILVEQVLREKGVLVRGLAHPLIFQGAGAQKAAPDSGAAAVTSVRDRQGRRSGQSDSNFQDLSSFMTTWGAVPVSSFNMHKLLQLNESVMLFPGGITEALKSSKQSYQLFWPDRAEFVRMAAKFEATIVPFAAIGAEDSVYIPFSGQEMLDLPLLGNPLRRQLLPAARTGVNEVEGLDTGAFPLVVPGMPRRWYFLFGPPIDTSQAWAKDRKQCQAVYGQVKAQVEANIQYLLQNREVDPYQELLPRLAYEASWSWKRQAPTFRH